MQNRSAVISAAVFLVIIAFPFFYNAFSVGLFTDAAAAPKPKVQKTGKCVEETSWMRQNHMRLLIHVREGAVREGIRLVDRSLHGCVSCHPHRNEFCKSCHTYVGVKPECWNCHNYP